MQEISELRDLVEDAQKERARVDRAMRKGR